MGGDKSDSGDDGAENDAEKYDMDVLDEDGGEGEGEVEGEGEGEGNGEDMDEDMDEVAPLVRFGPPKGRSGSGHVKSVNGNIFIFATVNLFSFF